MGFPKTCEEARITKGNHANNLFHKVVPKCWKEGAWQVRLRAQGRGLAKERLTGRVEAR